MMLCRKRKANFTKQELEVLVANVQARKDVLFTKRNTPVSNQAKQHAWECIARKVNSVDTVGGEHRTVNDVRRKWVCLLSETKKAEMQRRRRMAVAGPGASSNIATLSTAGLGGSGEYTPLLAENILNICKSMENGGRDGGSSVGRPSTRLSVDDANDLSMSSSSANTGGGFVSEMNLMGQSLTNNSSTNNSNNNNNNSDTGASYLQVTSVYSQNEHIDGVEVHLNDSSLGNDNSPTMSNKGSNIIANIKSLSRQTANMRGNSGGVSNNRVATDVNASSLYPMSNINNMQHLSNINSDIGIVHIAPNINSNVYADSTVYLTEAGGSNLTMPGANVMSLRKRRHSQQGVSNDQSRNHAETEELLSDDAEGDMGDVDTAAEMDPNVPSIEQIEWNVGPAYTNSTYINSSGSEQDRKATPDHQPYHVTISGAESDVETEVRPRRRKFYKYDEDYTEKLYWVEKKRLKIEERRLAIEEERLAIERERLELDKQRAKTNQQNAVAETLPLNSSTKPSGGGRTLSSPVVCTVTETQEAEDNDQQQKSSVTSPIWTSRTSQAEMTSVIFDVAEPLDSFADEDSVGISY